MISAMVRANSGFAVYKSQSIIDCSRYLTAERLALIELRLQLDIPLNQNDQRKSGQFITWMQYLLDKMGKMLVKFSIAPFHGEVE
jgi:hypothetical protein